jgi:hypothetical protein
MEVEMRAGVGTSSKGTPELGAAIESVPTALPLIGEGGTSPEPPMLPPVERAPTMLKAIPPDD